VSAWRPEVGELVVVLKGAPVFVGKGDPRRFEEEAVVTVHMRGKPEVFGRQRIYWLKGRTLCWTHHYYIDQLTPVEQLAEVGRRL